MCRAPRHHSIVSSTEEFADLVRLLTTNDQTQQSRKRVRFNNEIGCSAPSKATKEELKSLWHDPKEISTFKNNVRKLVTKGSTEKAETRRGLESCTYERQLQRHRTIQCIVSSFKKGMTPEQTAEIAKRCSEWNKDVAILQACHDYFEVHQPELSLPHIDNTPPAFPFQLKRASNSNTTQRRVRRRTV